MKSMIWTTAFGHEIYFDIAREWAKSLLYSGYEGDVFVISDRPIEIDGATVFVDAEGMAKAAIRRHVNLSEYDYVCFVDSDCVFNRNPEPRFRGEILIHQESAELSKRNSLFLSEEQVSKSAVSVNSGFVCLKGSIADRFLSEWEEIWKSCPVEEARKSADCYKDSTLDQPALQKYLMNYGSEWEPSEDVGMPFINGSSRPILHFCGPLNDGKNDSIQNKRVVLGKMKKHNGEYSANSLLYTIAFGDDIYYRMSEEMILSARREGYKGSIAVICDKPWHFPGGARTVLNGRDPEILLKTQIMESHVLDSYKYVLYADSDIIWTQNPSKMMKGNLPRVAHGPTLLHSAAATNAFMTPQEKEWARETKAHGINTGTVCVPGSMAYRFFSDWQIKWKLFDKSKLQDVWRGKAPDYQLYDEAALYVMIIRGEIEVEIMPKEEVFFPVMHAFPKLRVEFGYDNPNYDHRAICAHFVSTSLQLNHRVIYECMKQANSMNIPMLVEKFKADAAQMDGNDLESLRQEIRTLSGLVAGMGAVLKKLYEQMEKKNESVEVF